MDEAPDRCPTCATLVPEGRERCPGCGRVFGEQNRCPHCHAIAAVTRRAGRTVCLACGKPRDVDPGTTLVGGGSSVDRPGGRTTARARGALLRGFGALSIGGGVLAAAMAAIFVGGTAGLGLAAVGGLLGVGLGALALRAGADARRSADRAARRATERRLLALAEARGGVVTATEAAGALGLGVEEADAALTAMVDDGSRVNVELDDQGIIRYVFREVRASRPRVRVAAEAAPEEAEVEAAGAGEAEARAEAPDGG